MLLELERTAETDSSTIARPRGKKPFPVWEIIVGAAALAIAVLYCFTISANSATFQLEFNTTSEIPFKEELARIAYLVVENRDGTIEMFEDNRFGSAFIDRRKRPFGKRPLSRGCHRFRHGRARRPAPSTVNI